MLYEGVCVKGLCSRECGVGDGEDLGADGAGVLACVLCV